MIGIPTKLVRLFQALHQDTESCIKHDGSRTGWFPVETGVRQGCVLASDAFNEAMDRVLNRTTGRAMVGTSLGKTKYTDLDFADDMVLFSELWGVLELALLIFSEEAAELGLQINWNKTKIQSFSDFLPKPPDLFINDDTRVESVDSFVYLEVLINGSCTSSDEISRPLALAQSALGQLADNIWRSRLKEKTMIQLYGTYILPILLSILETWTFNQRDIDQTNAFG